MKVEWDAAKRDRSLAKHGLDFADAERFNWLDAIYFDDILTDYGEDRSRAIGFLGDRLVAIMYTLRGDRCRIISMRRATNEEHRLFVHHRR